MENPDLPDHLWAILDGGLWHATSPAGWSGMVKEGAIRIAGERYANSLCRSYGSVCLFDFGPSAVNVDRQTINLHRWFGRDQKCRVAVWLQINRAAVSPNLIDAAQLRAIWQQRKFQGLLIPGVEACHRGTIPIATISSMFIIDQHDLGRLQRIAAPLDGTETTISAFESALPPWEEDPFTKALCDALKRRN